ncbi:MAG: hypothetical protein KAS72_04915 [Phycisphaerales bacterium]|nr:hypothetical protein [Phycisphaerales bacterium]
MSTFTIASGALDLVLAQAEPTTTSLADVFDLGFSHLNILTKPAELMNLLSDMSPIWAGIFMILGWICVISGYRWHKPVVVICSLLIGVGAGLLVGQYVGSTSVVAVCLGALFAVLAAPFLRVTVAFFGAIVGAYVGANVWSLAAPESTLYWAGSLMGMVACSMLVFVAFRFVVILFTSVAGTTLLVFGTLAVMLHVEIWQEALRTSLEGNPVLLPMIVGVTAMISFVIQQSGGLVAVATAKPRTSSQPQQKPASA